MTNQRAIILLSQMYLPAFDEEEKQAIDKAIEALTALEPRVMTLAEIAKCSMCWLEDDVMLAPALFIGMERRANGTKSDVFLANAQDSDDCEFWYDLDDYGVTWWCWTSRPTDEQMEVTPWN